MARRKRSRIRKRFLYFFLNDKIHKVIKSSRAKDELIAWCYPDKKRVMYSYSQVEKEMSNAYSISQVAEMLNRHRVTIQDYILEGKVRVPHKIYPIGKTDSTWYKYMFSEKEIFEMHQFIIDAGYSTGMPSKSELKALLKHNMILYTKSSEGNFVPVWKAE
jgi:hypothetical protein